MSHWSAFSHSCWGFGDRIGECSLQFESLQKTCLSACILGGHEWLGRQLKLGPAVVLSPGSLVAKALAGMTPHGVAAVAPIVTESCLPGGYQMMTLLAAATAGWAACEKGPFR